MEGYRTAVDVFPLPLRQVLSAVPIGEQRHVQEIRLYRGRPVRLTVRGKACYLSENGHFCERDRALGCRDEWLINTFDTACRHSVYACQEQLCRGYVTAPNGCRIGVAGTAVVKNNTVTAFRDITSLCVRVAREHRGCAEGLLPLIFDQNGIHSLLICSEPCGGKSSILKDILDGATQRDVCVSVVDERGELAPAARRYGCDVLLYVPKATGIELAVRTLSPQVIVLDELGDGQEIAAVTACLYSGVPTVASVHCRTPDELLKRTALSAALREGAFEYLCFLRGREHPGEVGQVIKTEDWLHEMVGDRIDGVDRYRSRSDGMAETAAAGRDIDPFFLVDRAAGGSYPLFGNADR